MMMMINVDLDDDDDVFGSISDGDVHGDQCNGEHYITHNNIR